MKILIIEDEKKIASFIQKGLRSESFTVDSAFDGEEGLFLAEEGHYDLVILDIILPKLDGISICKRLRSSGKTFPIILLTAKDSVKDRVEGLNAGADDYLTKPFSFEELLARIKALSRRSKVIQPQSLRVGDLILNLDTHEAKHGKKEIALSATEFKLLQYLMQNHNHLVTKTQILEKVWGYAFDPQSNIVEVYIKYLRDKIDKGNKKSLIQTVHGVGYKICA